MAQSPSSNNNSRQQATVNVTIKLADANKALRELMEAIDATPLRKHPLSHAASTALDNIVAIQWPNDYLPLLLRCCLANTSRENAIKTIGIYLTEDLWDPQDLKDLLKEIKEVEASRIQDVVAYFDRNQRR